MALLVLGNVLVIIIILVVVEGLASWVFAIRQLAGPGRVAERLHTVHDPEVGWLSEPNVRRPDMYGPGKALTTNSRGFRGTLEYTPNVPAGKIRVVCSGDSFTLGYGVADDQTWCHLLKRADPRLETVNLGQGGYGFDQAYLWYRREAPRLQHQLHVFAFITDDFRRMTSNSFMGYPKPLYAVRDGELVLTNVPVPEGRTPSHWFTINAKALQSLRIVNVGGSLVDRLRPARANAAARPGDAVFVRSREVLPLLLGELQQFHRTHSSRLILVYLPTAYETEAATAKWRAFLEGEAARQGFVFVDLFEPFRKLSAEQQNSLFLSDKDVAFAGAAGHFSRAGNDTVAGWLYQRIAARGLLGADAKRW